MLLTNWPYSSFAGKELKRSQSLLLHHSLQKLFTSMTRKHVITVSTWYKIHSTNAIYLVNPFSSVTWELHSSLSKAYRCLQILITFFKLLQGSQLTVTPSFMNGSIGFCGTIYRVKCYSVWVKGSELDPVSVACSLIVPVKKSRHNNPYFLGIIGLYLSFPAIQTEVALAERTWFRLNYHFVVRGKERIKYCRFQEGNMFTIANVILIQSYLFYLNSIMMGN